MKHFLLITHCVVHGPDKLVMVGLGHKKADTGKSTKIASQYKRRLNKDGGHQIEILGQ